MVDKVALRQVFSEYFSFLCQFSFHRLLQTHHLSSGAGTIGQIVPTYQVGSVSLHPKKLKKTTLHIRICIVTCMCAYRRGSDWRMDLLTTYTWFLSASNYRGIYKLLETMPDLLSLFFRFLVTNLENGDSSASVLTSLPAGWHSKLELLTSL
jgi:hypothetical protein